MGVGPCPGYHCGDELSLASSRDPAVDALCPGGPAAWMAGVPDATPLTALTLPGTHNSGARRGGDLVACQSLSIAAQLRAGIRSLDIRARVVHPYGPGGGGGPGEAPATIPRLMIYHGIIAQRLRFAEDVLAEASVWRGRRVRRARRTRRGIMTMKRRFASARHSFVPGWCCSVSSVVPSSRSDPTGPRRRRAVSRQETHLAWRCLLPCCPGARRPAPPCLPVPRGAVVPARVPVGGCADARQAGGRADDAVLHRAAAAPEPGFSYF